MFDCTTCVVGIFKCFWILSSNSRTVFVPGIFQGLLRRILSHFFKYWPTGKSPRLIVISCTINYFPFSEGFIFRHAQLREASLFWGYVVNVSSAAIAFYYSVEITDDGIFVMSVRRRAIFPSLGVSYQSLIGRRTFITNLFLVFYLRLVLWIWSSKLSTHTLP